MALDANLNYSLNRVVSKRARARQSLEPETPPRAEAVRNYVRTPIAGDRERPETRRRNHRERSPMEGPISPAPAVRAPAPPRSPIREKTRSRSPPPSEAAEEDEVSMSKGDRSLRSNRGGRVKSPGRLPAVAPKKTKAMALGGTVSAAKKQKVAKPQWEEDINFVKRVLGQHFVENSKLRDLLVASCEPIFSQFKSDRHAYQNQMADLVGVALKDLQTDALEKKKESQWLVENEEQTNEITLARQERIETELSEQEESLSTKRAVGKNQKDLVWKNESIREEKKRDYEAKQREFNALEKAFVSDMKKADIFKNLKENPSDSDKINKNNFSTINPFFKKMGVGASLLAAAPNALSNALRNRGPFDQNVIDEITKVVNDHVFWRENELGEHRAALKELESALTTATEECQTAYDQLGSIQKEIEVIEDEIKFSKGEKKKVAQTIKDFPKLAQKNAEENKKNAHLIEFFDEAYKLFLQLRDREREAPPGPGKDEAPEEIPEKRLKLTHEELLECEDGNYEKSTLKLEDN